MKKYIYIIICIMIYCVPLGAVVYISELEKSKYVEDVEFNFEISSYGEVKVIERRDIYEYYIIDAVVTSIEEQTMKLEADSELLFEINEEISANQVIARNNNNEVKSTFDGIITDIIYEDKITVKYINLDKLVLEAYLPEEKYDVISTKNLQDEDGNKIELIKKSKVLEEGKFKVVLSVPKGTNVMYGKELNAFHLYTGVEYSNALVVDKSCVYIGDEGCYIRKVDELGKFIDDYEVQIGFYNDEYVCISGDGISEGDFCDAGYSSMRQGQIVDEEY